MCYFISHIYMWQLCTFWNIGKVSTIFRSEVTIFGRIAMGNYRAYTLLYRAMSSYALANSWRNFAATARQIGALDGEAANKCGRMTHIVATAIWSDDITYSRSRNRLTSRDSGDARRRGTSKRWLLPYPQSYQGM